MPRRFAALLVLLSAAVVIASCNTEDQQPVASPSPSATVAPVSLLDALPSPTPDSRLPSMPPEQAGTFVFYDDFEKSMDQWRTTGGAKGVGWHRLKAATCGGLFTMVLGEAENPPTRFVAGEAFLVLTQPLDLTKAKRPQLQYDVKGVTTPPESAAIVAEVRPPGGAWQAVTPRATARFPLVVTFTADLAPYRGKRVGLRFRGSTRPAREPSKGFYLDDIHVVEAQGK